MIKKNRENALGVKARIFTQKSLKVYWINEIIE